MNKALYSRLLGYTFKHKALFMLSIVGFILFAAADISAVEWLKQVIGYINDGSQNNLNPLNLALWVVGVGEGFTRKLEINGVGYRAVMQGNKLVLNLGYSHPVEMAVPAGLTVAVENNTQINISGADKQLLGQFASEIRSKRPPEPFKGKGVKYADEHIVRKEGKKK